MIASETWRRVKDHWGALALTGAYTMVIYMVIWLAAAVLLLPVLASAGVGWAALLRGGAAPGAGTLAALAIGGIAVLLVFLLLCAAFFLVAPLITGGLVHGVLSVLEDRPVRFGDLWAAGRRHWAPLFRLQVITAAVYVVLTIVRRILEVVPGLGLLVWLLGAGLIMLVLGGYGPYLTVTEGLGARATAMKAWRILSGQFVDVLLTVLVYLGAATVLGVVFFVLSLIPLLGWLAILALSLLVGPIAGLYLVIRYRTNIAPQMGPPGGAGYFDQGPPTGS